MKRIVTRSVAAVAMLTTLGLGVPTAALASTTTTTTTTTTLPLSPMKAYHVAQKAYLAQLRTINQTFVATVKTAKANFAAAIAVATNSAQRITARAALRLAIADATVARATALTALGKPPVNPEKSHR